MTTQKLPRYIAHYHPLYGIEKGLLAIGVLLTVKIVLILFGFLQNYHFLFAPVAKTVKYFIIGDAILVLYGFIVVIAFFSKLKKFLIPYAILCGLLMLKFILINQFLHIDTIKNLTSFSFFSYSLSFVLCIFIPYLHFSKRFRITFLRRMTKADLALIQERMANAQNLHKRKITAKTVSENKPEPKAETDGKFYTPPHANVQSSSDAFEHIPKSYLQGHETKTEKPGLKKITPYTKSVTPVDHAHHAQRKYTTKEGHTVSTPQTNFLKKSFTQTKSAVQKSGAKLGQLKAVKDKLSLSKSGESGKRSGKYKPNVVPLKKNAMQKLKSKK